MCISRYKARQALDFSQCLEHIPYPAYREATIWGMVQYTLHFVHSYNINIFRCKLSIRIFIFTFYYLMLLDENNKLRLLLQYHHPGKLGKAGHWFSITLGFGLQQRTGVFTTPVPNTYGFYTCAVENKRQDFGLHIVLNSVWKVQLICNDKVAYQTNKPGCFHSQIYKVWVRHFFLQNVISLTVFPWSLTLDSWFTGLKKMYRQQ